ILNGFVMGLLYALVALGFHFIYRGTGVFHLAHGAVYTTAAYAFIGWYSLLERLIGTSNSIQIPIALVVALLSAALLACALERFVYWPLYRKKAPRLIGFVASLGIYISLINLLAMLFGDQTRVLLSATDTAFRWGSFTLTKL